MKDVRKISWHSAKPARRTSSKRVRVAGSKLRRRFCETPRTFCRRDGLSQAYPKQKKNPIWRWKLHEVTVEKLHSAFTKPAVSDSQPGSPQLRSSGRRQLSDLIWIQVKDLQVVQSTNAVLRHFRHWDPIPLQFWRWIIAYTHISHSKTHAYKALVSGAACWLPARTTWQASDNHISVAISHFYTFLTCN